MNESFMVFETAQLTLHANLPLSTLAPRLFLWPLGTTPAAGPRGAS